MLSMISARPVQPRPSSPEDPLRNDRRRVSRPETVACFAVASRERAVAPLRCFLRRARYDGRDPHAHSQWGKRMEWASSREPMPSVFVTAVAWIFIALEGAASIILLIENLIINTILPVDRLREGMAQAVHAGTLPSYFPWILEHVRAGLFVILIYALIKLAAAIGLLKRRNCARLLFIGFLAFSILWSFAAIA